MIIILIFFIILVIVVLSFYLILFKKNRPKFNEQKGLVEFSAIFITIFLTLIAFMQQQISIESSTKDFNRLIKNFEEIINDVKISKLSLDEVKKSMKALPAEIDNFGNTINSLNGVIKTQQIQIKNSLTSLDNNINNFSNTLDTLSSIFERKPIIDIDLEVVEEDSLIVLEKLVVSNIGTLTADIYTIRIYFKNAILENFSLQDARITTETENEIKYQVDFTNQYIIPGVNKYTIFSLQGIVKPKLDSPIEIIVFVYYTSKFGFDANETRTFKYSLSKS